MRLKALRHAVLKADKLPPDKSQSSHSLTDLLFTKTVSIIAASIVHSKLDYCNSRNLP